MSGDVAELERETDALPDGWRSAELGDIITLEYGRSLPEKARQPGSVAVYGSNGVVGTHNEALVLNGGIIVGRKGTAGSVTVSPGPFWPIDTTYFVKARETVDWDWLAATLHHARLNELNEATGVPGLNRDKAYRQPILLPPLDEQRRIAEVLRSVDEALKMARRVAEQCEQVLRLELDSIVTNLLADGVVQAKLGEVAKVKGGKRLPKGSAYSDGPTGNPYIRVTDWRDYEIRLDDIRFISDEIAQSIWRYTISQSDLFISIAGSVGLVAAVPDELDGAYLTENAAKICINDPKALNATFLLAVLRSRALTEQISKHKGVGGGVPKLALFRIEDLDIPLPDLSVQADIASSYQSLRAGIESARNAVDQLEKTKKEVMSDLLSGRVRVPA